MSWVVVACRQLGVVTTIWGHKSTGCCYGPPASPVGGCLWWTSSKKVSRSFVRSFIHQRQTDKQTPCLLIYIRYKNHHNVFLSWRPYISLYTCNFWNFNLFFFFTIINSVGLCLQIHIFFHSSIKDSSSIKTFMG
jgi:hypothetical protein